VQVGGVQVDVGELDVIETPGAEGADDVIETGADPRHLRLGDPRVHPQRGHEIIDGAGGHPVDVGLHHHRVQGLVDASTRFQDRREERPLAELGDAQLDVTGLGRHQMGSGAVAVGGAGLGALIAASADVLGRFHLDELLHHEANCVTDQIDTLTGAERIQQLGQDRLSQGHRSRSPSVRTWRYTPRITPMAPPRGGPSRLPQTPPRQGTLLIRCRGRPGGRHWPGVGTAVRSRGTSQVR
jgi:hypothetical protein